ncbi:MAG: NAD(P)H-hydrate dehydratase [Bacteroidaceae bacterium]
MIKIPSSINYIQHEKQQWIDAQKGMQNALSQADLFLKNIQPYLRKRIFIFAGSSHNGLQGIALGLRLAQLIEGNSSSVKGVEYVEVIHVTPHDVCDGNTLAMRENLPKRVHVTVVTERFIPPVIVDDDLVIDALFGVDIESALEKGFAALSVFINNQPALTISIELPTGLFPDGSNVGTSDKMVLPDVTLLSLPTQAEMMVDTHPLMGKMIRTYQDPATVVQESDMAAKKLIVVSPDSCHKGDFGHGLLVAGSFGMAGASIMAAQGALRAGIGKLSILSPQCNRLIVQSTVPQAICIFDTSEFFWKGTVEQYEQYQAICIGPGIGTHEETLISMRYMFKRFKESNISLILDADALSLIGEERSLLDSIPRGSILTPHYGELERLVGRCTNHAEALKRAIALAEDIEGTIIFKGWRTAIIHHDGTVRYNDSGNVGMATGGSGDVLAGIILALKAEGYDSLSAALLGTYIHGKAGDIAAKAYTKIAMNALDIIEKIPEAWKAVIDAN